MTDIVEVTENEIVVVDNNQPVQIVQETLFNTVEVISAGPPGPPGLPNPFTDGGDDLGTPALGWGNLYLTSGGDIIFGNDVTIAHTADLLTVSGGVMEFSSRPTFAGSGILATSDIGVTVQAYDPDLQSWLAINRAAGFDTWVTTPSVANLMSLLTDEAAGLGNFMVTPSVANLMTLLTDDAAGLGTWMVTPSVANLMSLLTDDATGLGTFMVTPSSANLAALVTDETGTGSLVFGTTPTFTTSMLLSSGFVFNWNSGDLTLTHSLNTLTLTGGSLVLDSTGLTVGASVPFSDSAGTLTLQNVDAIDATTESTIETAIDTLANLTSVQGRTISFGGNISLAGALTTAGAVSISAYGATLVDDADAATARTTLGLVIGTDVQAYDADLQSWAGVTRAASFDTFVATPSSANLRSLVTDETGTGGSLVFATAPVISDPDFTGLVDAQQTFALTGDISPAQITANQNDYAPTGLSTASVLRLNTDASRNITGLTGGSDGRVILIHNIGTADIVLTDEDAASTAANRFALAANVTLAGDQSAMIQYDATTSRWRMIGGTGSGGGGGSGDVTAASNFGTDNRVIRSDGTLKGVQSSDISIDDTTFAMYPSTNDVGTLGKSGNAWGDLFLASGGVINFNAGDVTITHSANTLTFAGAASGYLYDAVNAPSTNDGAALGSTTLMWSDLFLASGGVINFNNGDVLVTHSANTLTFSGASSGYLYDALNAPSTNDGAALGSTSLMWSDLFLASGGVINFNNGDVTVTHSANQLDIDGGVVDFDRLPTVNGDTLSRVTSVLASGSLPAANSVDIPIDMTGYSNIAVMINGMSHNNGTNRNAQVAYSDDGTNFNALRDVTPSIAAASTANGVYVLFGAGVSAGAKAVIHSTTDAAGATQGAVLVGETGITVEVRISLNSTGSFDAGTYIILGF